MKKTPLQRHAPLKRKTRLRPVSKSKDYWNARYEEAYLNDEVIQRCACCGTYRKTDWMERHHPRGRNGKNILFYVYLCGRWLTMGGCNKHVEIHDNGKKARREGWLQPSFDGRPDDPDAPKPWKHLPEKRV